MSIQTIDHGQNRATKILELEAGSRKLLLEKYLLTSLSASVASQIGEYMANTSPFFPMFEAKPLAGLAHTAAGAPLVSTGCVTEYRPLASRSILCRTTLAALLGN